MSQRPTLSRLASGTIALAALSAPAAAFAQAPPLSEAIVVGAWTFRPSAEIRVRGEYRHDAFGLEGVPTAFQEGVPPIAGLSARVPKNAWALQERARVGVKVDRGPVTGAIVLQDSRVFGDNAAIFPASNLGGLGGAAAGGLGGLGTFPIAGLGTSVHEAYVDIHSRSGRRMFLRIGRQRVVWGDGRLVGESDWSPTPRSLHAARFGFQVGDFDIETMAALLVPPGTYQIPTGDTTAPFIQTRSSGAQLYGLDITWHFLPLLNVELTGLARIARDLYNAGSPPLIPGDTYVIDARLFGDRRGFRYALEGAVELGRVASYGDNRDITAFALALTTSLETALPWHLTFDLHSSFASGDHDGSAPGSTLTRFDPILGDEFANHSPMGLYGWSNMLEIGGGLSAKPIEELSLRAGYRFAALASDDGPWITSSSVRVGGADPATRAQGGFPSAGGLPVLGQELDFTATLTPWDPIEFKAGYGLFLFSDHIRTTKRAGPIGAQHWVFLQTIVHAP
jgi:hypothetical protein